MNNKPIGYTGLFLVVAGIISGLALLAAVRASSGWLWDIRGAMLVASMTMLASGIVFGIMAWNTAPGKVAACLGGIFVIVSVLCISLLTVAPGTGTKPFIYELH